MAFAFGQKINLVQGNRSGINPIKWGFIADIPQGANGYDLDAALIGSPEYWTTAGMYIGPAAFCGNVNKCIGNFGALSGLGVTSGNNINSNLSPYGAPSNLSKEGWRNVQVPPNVKGITMYIQTRPADPKGVSVRDPIVNGCSIYSLCDGPGADGACDQCDWAPGGGTPAQCDGQCSGCPYCCGASGGDGATSGNYCIHVDLTGIDQQTLYMYTGWFNGTDEADALVINGCSPAYPAGSANRCTDNMRFTLFPSDGSESTPSSWPHYNMADPYLDIRVYKAGHTQPSTGGLSNGAYYCTQSSSCDCSNGVGSSENCETCNLGICVPCSQGGAYGLDASESYITTTTYENSATGTDYIPTGRVTITEVTEEELWGPNGGKSAPLGLWNSVFGWNTDREPDFISLNYGGPKILGCGVTCGFNAGLTSNTYDVNTPCFCNPYYPNGEGVSGGLTGGQIVGFHVG